MTSFRRSYEQLSRLPLSETQIVEHVHIYEEFMEPAQSGTALHVDHFDFGGCIARFIPGPNIRTITLHDISERIGDQIRAAVENWCPTAMLINTNKPR